MSSLESRTNTSPSSERELGDQDAHFEADAEFARSMHHRQIFRRTLVAVVIVGIVAAATFVGVPVARQLKTVWFLEAQGFRVDWDLGEDDWMQGGTTRVGYSHGLWLVHSLDSVLPSLTGVMNLEALNLAECPVSEQSLTVLGQLVQLRELDLTRLNYFRHGSGFLPSGHSEFGLTDACLPPVVALPRLRTLYLSGNRITDNGLELIGGMTRLEDLDLTATDVTDRGLVHLQSLRKLKTLNLAGTLATTEGIKKLQSALPGVEISMDIDPEVEQRVRTWRLRAP